MNKNHDPKTGQFASNSLHLVGGQMHTGAEVNALSMRHGGLHMIPGGYGGPHVMGGGAQPRQAARAVPPPRNVPPPKPPARSAPEVAPGHKAYTHANDKATFDRYSNDPRFNKTPGQAGNPPAKQSIEARQQAAVKAGGTPAEQARRQKMVDSLNSEHKAEGDWWKSQEAIQAAKHGGGAKPPPAAAKHGARPIQPNEHGPGPAFGPHAKTAQQLHGVYGSKTPRETHDRIAKDVAAGKLVEVRFTDGAIKYRPPEKKVSAADIAHINKAQDDLDRLLGGGRKRR